MKKSINALKKISLFALFAASLTLFGCNAADLAGPSDPPQTQSDCTEDCPDPHNI